MLCCKLKSINRAGPIQTRDTSLAYCVEANRNQARDAIKEVELLVALSAVGNVRARKIVLDENGEGNCVDWRTGEWISARRGTC